MALYWHFRSKEALLAGLADRIWGEIDTDVDPAADWPQQLRGMLESLVRVLRAHPCASQLLLPGEKLSSDAALRATETALGGAAARRVRSGARQRGGQGRAVDWPHARDERAVASPARA